MADVSDLLPELESAHRAWFKEHELELACWELVRAELAVRYRSPGWRNRRDMAWDAFLTALLKRVEAK